MLTKEEKIKIKKQFKKHTDKTIQCLKCGKVIFKEFKLDHFFVNGCENGKK